MKVDKAARTQYKVQREFVRPSIVSLGTLRTATGPHRAVARLALIGSLVLGPLAGTAHAQPNPAHMAALVNGSKQAVSAPEPPRPVHLQLVPKALIDQGGGRPFDAKTGTCNCDFGAQGNTIFEVGTGVFSITALLESGVGVFDETTAPGVCSDKSCAYYGWNSPGPNWRVLKFVISAPDPVLIMDTWCS